jgi:hypothetical protein
MTNFFTLKKHFTIFKLCLQFNFDAILMDVFSTLICGGTKIEDAVVEADVLTNLQI